MNLRHHLSLALSVLAGAASLSAAGYDLVIRNAQVVDGTGGPAIRADIGVNGGRIAAVGEIPRRVADVEIDATGLVAAPGFIDVHTHAEGILGMPLAENFVRMGVTTLVLGNCGSSTLDVGGFFRKVDNQAISVNVATLIGHGSVREDVMGGAFDRAPTAEEMDRMRGVVSRAMQDGAVGMSTGLIYLPGTFAETDELIDLAKVVASYDGVYASHMRNEAGEIFEALEELFRIAREARVRAEISHIKLSGRSNWGQTDRVIGAIEAARAEGLTVTQDQYAYAASSTGISQLIPDSALEGGKFLERLADREQKEAMIAEMKEELHKGGQDSYAFAVVAYAGFDTSLNGLNVVQVAKKLRGSDTLDDQIETILEIQKRGGASGVFHSMSETDLQSFMRHPNTMIAADSGLRKFNQGVPHPRGYGNNARVLARYVRELKALSLEEAVRRMTSLPASTFRISERGTIAPGNWADLVVFDPGKVQDHATFEAPHQYPTGFKYVWVNGKMVVRNDTHTGRKPGRAIRHRGPAKGS